MLGALGYRVVDMLELPREVFFDLPRVVLIGNLQVSVENHQGLLAYDQQSLTLALDVGRLVIAGEGLTVGMVRPSEITVSGRISSVRFEPSAGEGRN
jgi:sporulation protein YqfC